jgi:tRNA threonylcarbamoyl adenosine modification protein YeaZ
MLILALDTTSEYGGAGIFHDSERLAVALAERAMTSRTPGGQPDYSVVLFQMVDGLLAQTGFNLRGIELFVVANGPGSFTGIRVGVAAAQAWGEAFGRPVFGASVLEAMAEESRAETDWTLPIADARRGEFFVAAFRTSQSKLDGPNRKPAAACSRPESANEQLEQNRRPQALVTALSKFKLPPSALEQGFILKPEELREVLSALGRSGAVTCVMREHDVCARAFQASLAGEDCLPREETRGSALPAAKGATASPSVRWHMLRGTLVDAAARLALRASSEGRLQSPAELDALYIRRPDAEMHWKDS